jgi:peroxiredoxin
VDEGPYVTLAELVRYEGAAVALDDPLLNAAMARLQAEEQGRAKVDFTLKDIKGHSWTLHELRGKVVLVNFWATWCEPCLREMPDLEALNRQFGPNGLAVLAISDEDARIVNTFAVKHRYSFPLLLDPGGNTGKAMFIDGVPKTFLYDRQGKLVAQAMDMRTRAQLLAMLKKAGVR